MDIKEIALKAGYSTVPAYWLSDEKPIACSTSNLEKLVSFAEALIAELAKQNEPVAFTNSAQLGYVTSGQHQDIPLAMWSRNTSYSGADIPLYALPPTAEQIANETAEAIAEYCRNQDHYCLATEIESGAWKEFKK